MAEKLEEAYDFKMCFRRLLCVRIEIDQLQLRARGLVFTTDLQTVNY